MLFQAYTKDFPDFVVVLLDYLEELYAEDWSRIALKVMPGISERLNELSSLAWYYNTTEEYFDIVESDLDNLIYEFLERLMRVEEIKDFGKHFEKIKELFEEEADRYYSERKYFWKELDKGKFIYRR
jgi:hypothetical protein